MPDEMDASPDSSAGNATGGGDTPQATETPAQPSPAAPEATTTPSVESPAPEAPPRDDRGRFAPKEPETKPEADPVADAMDRLARPKAAPKAAEEAPKPAQPPKPAVQPAKPSSEAPKTEVAKVDPAAKDPLDGFSEAERASLKTKTRERIEGFHRRMVEAEAKLASNPTSDPVAGDFATAVKEFGLADDLGFVPPENLASLVKVQASINRAHLAIQQGRRPAAADLSAVALVRDQVQEIAKTVGVAAQAAPEAKIQPHEGELPPAYKDLVEVYGIPEADVRLLAAIKARGAAPAASAPAPASAPAAPQAPAPEAKAEGVDMDALYAQRLLGDLVRAGVPANKVRAHVTALQSHMVREVQQRFPFVSEANVPQVFDRLDAKERYEITLAAHRTASGASSPSRPSTPPPPTRTTHGGAPPRRTAPADDGDPVQAAVDRLSRSEE